MKKRYNFIVGSVAGLCTDDTDIVEEPLINIFSGSRIKLNFGEGILDFIYADFLTPFKTLAKTTALFESIRKMPTIKKTVLEAETSDDIAEKKKIYTHEQEYIEDFYNYEMTFSAVKEVAYASLYSAICPPMFSEENGYNKPKLNWYGNYLLTLQNEYKEMIEFCYDEDFYPDVLGALYPSERLGIYRRIHNLPASYTRKESVSIMHNRIDGNKMPYGIPHEELIKRLTSMNMSPTNKEIEFAKDLGVPIDSIMLPLRHPFFMSINYTFRSVEDILELEFTKMLEQNIRFRKCKRCGKYFIMKGNYDTNYCDRIAEGETRNCQELAAIENYKAKIADNQAIQIYNKYYKRYAARVRVRQIKETNFKKWKYEAMSKRDECSDGIISIEEYTEWMEASFPNRKRRTE